MRLTRWLRAGFAPPVDLVDGRLSDHRSDSSPPRPPDLTVLLRAAAEAVILQDRADAVLRQIGRHAPLGEVAPIAGPLSRRFFALRTELPPSCADPELQRLRHTIDLVLYHHAMQLATAMDFLAVEWRSAELARQVETIHDLGPVTELLDTVYHDLAARAAGSQGAGDA